jgi:kumamolisin
MKFRSYIKRHANPSGPWTIPDVCAAYHWPTNATCRGAIGIIELGGGWHQSDVTAAFSNMNLPPPVVTDISVDGTKNTPGSDADGEVALDIQVAGASYAVATGRAAEIRIYWCQNIAEGVHKAAADGCAACSISWGAPEEVWGKPACVDMNDAAMLADQLGMATFAAAGDNDADDGDKSPSVDCPACCPHIIGCGGTSLPSGGPEVVWNNNPGRANGEGTGGGYSSFFAAQAWQIGAPKAPSGLGRMVPDVAANADPATGYIVVLNGQEQVFGGTSAVAPLYAGLVAALSINPGLLGAELFRNRAWFNDITSGSNGTYAARIGPDPCTGLGSPRGAAFNLR